MEDFLSMTRKQLQALCKKHGVPANLKNGDMAKWLSSLLKDDKSQAKEPLGSTAASGEVRTKKVTVKKKVRFHPKNQVYEFVDNYVESVEQEQAEGRRDRASRRTGLRKRGLPKSDNYVAVETAIFESEEIFSNQFRLTRSRKAVGIVSPPLGRRDKIGGNATGKKVSSSHSAVADSVQSNANKVSQDHFVAGKGETEIPRERTRSKFKYKGDDKSVTGSDDTMRPKIEHDLLRGHRVRLHHEVPIRKSSRVAMKNISNMAENQKRGSAWLHEKQDQKRSRNEFGILISDSAESIVLAREKPENASKKKKNHILGKPLRRSMLSTSTSTTGAVLEFDSEKEKQQTCGNIEGDSPMVKPPRRSRRKSCGSLELSEASSLSGNSNHTTQPMKEKITLVSQKTSQTETECCNEVITTHVTGNSSKCDLFVDPKWLSKPDYENKHHKRAKRSARMGKGVNRCIESFPGENKKTHMSEIKNVSSSGLFSVIEVIKDGISSYKTMTPSGSEIHDEFVEACVLTSAALLVEESTVSTTEEASVLDLTESLSVPALEKPENYSEFSDSFLYDVPQVGCTGPGLSKLSTFILSMEVGEKNILSDDKADYDTSLSSETVRSKGGPHMEDSKVEKAMKVFYKTPIDGEDAPEMTSNWYITRDSIVDTYEQIWNITPTKQNAVDGGLKEDLSVGAEQSMEVKHAYLNGESSFCCRSNMDKPIIEQDKVATNECQLSPDSPGSEVFEHPDGDINTFEMTSHDHALANKHGQCSFICTPHDEGKSDGHGMLNSESVRSTSVHGLTCDELYYDKSNERVSHEETDAHKQDGTLIILAYLDAEVDRTVVQFSEPREGKHPISLWNFGPNTFESEEVDAEICSPKHSLSLVAVTNIDEKTTNNYLAADDGSDRSPLHFTEASKISGDVGKELSSATKNEFAREGHTKYTEEGCTALHVTNSTVDHPGNVASNDGILVSAASFFSFHESQAERDAETTDAVDYSTQANKPHSNEDNIRGTTSQNVNTCCAINDSLLWSTLNELQNQDDKKSADLNTYNHLQDVSQDLCKEFTSECREENGLSLYYPETRWSEERIALCSPKATSGNHPDLPIGLENFSCTDTFIKHPCLENALVDLAIVSSKEALVECTDDDYFVPERYAEFNSTIDSRVKQSITEVMNEDGDDYTIPDLRDKICCAPGALRKAEQTSGELLNCHDHDAEFILMRKDTEVVNNSEYKASTEIGDLTSVNSGDREECNVKKFNDSMEISISKYTLLSHNAGVAKLSTSTAQIHSFDKLEGLLREIDDYFEWRNSSEKALEGCGISDDTKEKA